MSQRTRFPSIAAFAVGLSLLLSVGIGPPGTVAPVEAASAPGPTPTSTPQPLPARVRATGGNTAVFVQPGATPTATPRSSVVGVGTTVQTGGNVVALPPNPSPTPCPSSINFLAVRACVGSVLTTSVGFGTGFDAPEREPSLYNLTLPEGVNTTFSYNQTFEVERPAVTFQFPIGIDTQRYGDALGRLEPDVVWTMQITAEACLTSDEAPAWTNAHDLGTPCDPEVNSKNAARDWYSVGQFNSSNLPLIQHQVQTGQDATLQVNLQQILTPLRFHYVGHDLTCCNSIDNETVPVNVIVLPVALMQLKVIPFTIMYVPPGNASQASVTMTTTYTTTETAGASTQMDNTNKQDDWTQQEQKLHAGNTIFDLLGGQFDLSSSEKWDHSTTIATGQQASLSRSDTVSTATALTLGIGPPPSGSVDPQPGAGGTFQNAAFWNDLIVVIPRPQFGLWDFYGVMSMQMLGAASPGDDPHFPIRLRDLDACANSAAPFANGFPLRDTTVTLNAADCQALAALDPFWGKGQSADISARAKQIGVYPYGVDPNDPVKVPGFVNIADSWDQKSSTTDSKTTTYKSTVEEVHSSQGSEGLKVSLGDDKSGGGSLQMTFSYGSSLTNSAAMGIVYSSSTTQTNDNALQVTGNVKDTLNRGNQPYVEIWQDDLFDTPMYRDPDAPSAP
jgi:hypothetical protein